MTIAKGRRLAAAGIMAAAMLALSDRPALAQAAPAPIQQVERGYAEAVAQSAFGSETSQSYGAEVGWSVWENVQLFLEGGQVRDVATDALNTNAQTIAGALQQLQPAAVTFSVKQPITFVGTGVRYALQMSNAPVRPYLLSGFGIARVKKDVTFQLDGADATNAIGDFVTLGRDLSGTDTSPMLTFGAGAVWPAWRQLLVDFQFRYGRIFADQAINVSRAGVGVGVWF